MTVPLKRYHVTWLGRDGAPLGPPELLPLRPRDMDAAITLACSQLRRDTRGARFAYGFYVAGRVRGAGMISASERLPSYVVPAWRADGPAPDALTERIARYRDELAWLERSEAQDRGYTPLMGRGARVKRIPMLDQARDDA